MPNQAYRTIVSHYEACLSAHGHGARAVDWKTQADAATRYHVMLDLAKDLQTPASLLDFGCGLAGLKTHIDDRGLRHLSYTGLEISKAFAKAARNQHPHATILCLDVLSHNADLPTFDYIVMNGIFTRRHDVTESDMFAYLQKLLTILFAKARIGLAFNVMSKAVDYENGALFHPDPGALIAFVTRSLTQHYVLRNDYGLYETTMYLYREPSQNFSNIYGVLYD